MTPTPQHPYCERDGHGLSVDRVPPECCVLAGGREAQRILAGIEHREWNTDPERSLERAEARRAARICGDCLRENLKRVEFVNLRIQLGTRSA